jgi:hypothetical protein
MSIDELLREFGSRSGLGVLSRNGEGVCRLIFNGGLIVDIEAPDRDPDLHLTATVGPLAPRASASLLRALLSANLMTRESGGAALALDLNRDEVVLHRQLPAEGLDYAAFERSLDSFLSHLERCRRLLDEESSAPVSGLADSFGEGRIRV